MDKSKKSAETIDEEINELEQSSNQSDQKSIISTINHTIQQQQETNSQLVLPKDSFIHIQLPSSVGESYSDNASTILPLVSHHVKCHVTYPIVQVVSTMTFNSSHNRSIEGELIVPMPDTASMIGYAMEIEGKLVDAVPVEKEKAKAVFESEVRSGGTVSIVEKLSQSSNCFRTKVYPLNPNQDKTIQVKYQVMLNEKIYSKEEENGTVEGNVFIPIVYSNLEKLRADSKIEFTLNETSLQGYETELSMSLSKFEKTEKENQLLWTSKNVSKRSAYFQITKDQLKDNMSGFNLKIKKESNSVNDILLAVENGYFMTSIPVPKIPKHLKNQSRIGDRIQIIWDCSLSQESSHIEKVTKLTKIVEGVGATSIVLTQFSSDILNNQTFDNHFDLLKYVQSEEFIYDGGSNMLLFNKNLLNEGVDYCIAFTDGVHTFGHEIGPMCTFDRPIYFVNTSSVVNSNLLKHVSTKSGGIYLNANELSDTELINSIGKPVLSFAVADYEDNDLTEVYPNEPITLVEGEVFKLFGMFSNKTTTSSKLAVSFRYGPNVYHVQEIILPISEMTQTDTPIVPYLWAQKKIESLSAFPHLFKEEIKKIGLDFRIVTDTSSLVVLENLDQYLKHDITPPETLPQVLEEFKKKKQEIANEQEKNEKEKIERVVSVWKSRVEWHSQEVFLPTVKPSKGATHNDAIILTSDSSSVHLDIPPPPPSYCPISPPPPPPGMCSGPPPPSSTIASSLQLCNEMATYSPSPLLRQSSVLSRRSREDPRLIDHSLVEETPCVSSDLSSSSTQVALSQPEGTISIKAWTPDAAYCNLIKSSANPYKEYLNQRKTYRDSPAFYLDVADMFLTLLNSRELGVRVLSNVAELELENVQLYRIVGYRLDQAEELELAEWVFEKIKKLSPHEPQSYRDLALVKERMGKLEEAMQLFNKVITDKWDSRFDEIEMTAATEMNHLLAANPNLPIVDSRLIHKFDLDIRISMSWDTDMIDLDLHVKEPAPQGEHAYFGHNRTTIGGYVSRDFRQGYGPEEYMIKKAPKGVYKVTTNYFSNHSQNLTGGTTVLCTFFTNYMRKEEKRQMVTIRISSHKQDIEVCDIEIK